MDIDHLPFTRASKTHGLVPRRAAALRRAIAGNGGQSKEIPGALRARPDTREDAGFDVLQERQLGLGEVAKPHHTVGPNLDRQVERHPTPAAQTPDHLPGKDLVRR